MKALFRYLRGELNGFYINQIYNSVNILSEGIKNFITKFHSMRFEQTMEFEILKGIGKFASVFLPMIEQNTDKVSVRLSDSHIVDGEEVSNSGLYNINSSRFEYQGTVSDGDINDLATPELRSSMSDGSGRLGYIVEGDKEDLFKSNYLVNRDKIRTFTPSDRRLGYSEFYGDEFLFISEIIYVLDAVAADLYFGLLTTLQWCRYNGVSLGVLLKIIEILFPEGMLKIKSLGTSENGGYYIMRYVIDDAIPVENKEQKLYLFFYIINLKFCQVHLIEET